MAMAVVITATRNVRAGTPRSCAGTCVVGRITFAADRQACRRQSPTLSNYTDAPASAWHMRPSLRRNAVKTRAAQLQAHGYMSRGTHHGRAPLLIWLQTHTVEGFEVTVKLISSRLVSMIESCQNDWETAG